MTGAAPVRAILLILALTLAACSDDTRIAPNYEMEFVDVLTDASGTGSTLVTDRGEHLSVTNPFTALKADTAYRYVAYLIRQGNGVEVAAASRAICDTPKDMSGEDIKTDSVKMQSIWRGSHYINLTLMIAHRDQQHEFAFIDRGISQADDGHKTLCIRLYHDAGNDFPAFSATCYLSCSLKPYKDLLREGRDSVCFVINEYKKGQATYRLPY